MRQANVLNKVGIYFFQFERILFYLHSLFAKYFIVLDHFETILGILVKFEQILYYFHQ